MILFCNSFPFQPRKETRIEIGPISSSIHVTRNTLIVYKNGTLIGYRRYMDRIRAFRCPLPIPRSPPPPRFLPRFRLVIRTRRRDTLSVSPFSAPPPLSSYSPCVCPLPLFPCTCKRVHRETRRVESSTVVQYAAVPMCVNIHSAHTHACTRACTRHTHNVHAYQVNN